jgi:hypothetical protein
MAQLKPIDYDPFAPTQGGPKLTPVDDDPFAQSAPVMAGSAPAEAEPQRAP